ncbi:hypothetical protein [Dactylosporangium matsuzakiense]|uniref:Uncharacterized protein n=1 Tax=Dactylosporangium matsuzakiense TaxID=53360 RepID=A0A9W6KFR0_9ACTN|nr:hypothetical protein [Dactylosporangium matsuzakiense]UWZ45373.1 hypothetical protein Dmats_02140 [Dactylosporangium matsuzakiense]GLK98643.1 hypothetical protein GCM10017581_003840 [Dactylosporangium matsuzakiense]
MRARTRTSLSTLAGLAGAVVAAAVLGAPTSAQAAPEAAYPAPAPQIRVSAASIQAGDAVRLQGRGFMDGEPVDIAVKYRNSDTYGVRITGDRRADDRGRFSARVRLNAAGYAVIRVIGKESHKTLKVAVRVKDGHMQYNWGNGWGGWPDDIFDGTPLASNHHHHWDGHDRPVGFYGPFRAGWSPFRLQANETTTTAAPEHKTYGADLIPGILGLTALAGSGWISFRRRRTS